MALIWQRQRGEQNYEVRSAGNSLRLYTQGVFHSQWNPRHPLAGHLWDLLFLPSILVTDTQGRIDKALLLGVGGGAVINALNHFLAVSRIIGVDLDRTHLHIARRFFIGKTENAELVEQDARDFVTRDKRRFSLVVEDLFGHDPRDGAVRAVTMDDGWLSALAKRVDKAGILVINFESQGQLRKALSKKHCMALGFQSLFALSLPRYENAIAVCTKDPYDSASVRAKIEAFARARQRREVKNLHYTLRRIF